MLACDWQFSSRQVSTAQLSTKHCASRIGGSDCGKCVSTYYQCKHIWQAPPLTPCLPCDLRLVCQKACGSPALQHCQPMLQALRAEDLDNDGEADYGVTGGRGLLASAHSAGIGRSSRSIAASQGMGPSSATGRPSDLASVASDTHSPAASLVPATSLAATRRGQSPAFCTQYPYSQNPVIMCLTLQAELGFLLRFVCE